MQVKLTNYGYRRNIKIYVEIEFRVPMTIPIGA